MPSRVISQQLKIYSEKTNTYLSISKIPNCSIATSLEDADIILDSSQKLTFENINITEYFAKNNKIKSSQPYSKYIDQQSMLYYVNTKQALYTKIATVPYHEFINNSSFNHFVEMFKTIPFDLIKLSKDDETILATDTLENLISSHNELLQHTLIEDVIFSSTPKYMVRQIKNSNMKHIYGCISSVDNITHIATNIKLPEQLSSLVKLLFDGFAGFFEIEYFDNVNKHEIFSFKLKMNSDILSTDVMNIPQVQTTFNE
jgi:hypothetical protein